MSIFAQSGTAGSAVRRQSLTLGLVGILLIASILAFAQRSTSRLDATPASTAASNSGNQALYFEKNGGQSDPSVRFMAHAPGGTLFFTKRGVTLVPRSPVSEGSPATTSRSNVVRLEFVGANAATVASDGPELAAKVNYFIGNDPAGWHTGLPVFAAISYDGLYDGVALRYEGTQGAIEGTYTVAAGADPSQIRWRYAGASSLKVDTEGNLLIGGTGSDILLTERAPLVWQERGGNKVPVAAQYVTALDGTISFALGTYDRSLPLTIDPTLTFSTYLGGTAGDEAHGVAVDPSGNVYVVGFTSSTNFPTVNAFQGTNAGVPDVFLTKFNPTGGVVYSTYLGGVNGDVGYSVAVDSVGNPYVTGYTGSNNFPTQNAYQPTYSGNSAFLTKFNASGSALLYSTYFGGAAGNDTGWGVAADNAGNAYIAGSTAANNFPTLHAYQGTYGGGFNDAFLARLDTTQAGSGSLIYSTYLGGTLEDVAGGYASSQTGHGVAADAAGNAYITGQTASTNFPTRNALQSTYQGGATDAWVSKLNTNAGGDPSLIYSTYLGGNGVFDYGRDVDIDGAGNAYITGQTSSANFPTVNSYAACSNSILSPFVTKLNPSGNALVYSTCMGAAGQGIDIAVDGAGRAHIGGLAQNGFPQVSPVQPSYGGGSLDAIAFTLGTAGNTLDFSTYLGGSATEGGVGIASDGADKTYVSGQTLSTNFPTQNAYQPACGNNCAASDAFVTVIDSQVIVTPTSSPTSVASSSPTNTPTNTRTVTVTRTATRTPTITPTPFATFTPVAGDNPPVITVPLSEPYRVGVEIGNYLALRFDADDPDVGDIVSFSVSGLPVGATFPIPTPGNPIHSTLVWRPQPSDIGVYYVTVTATDSHGAQDVAIVEIDVVEGCVPYFTDVFTSNYFYIAVQYLFCHQIISGYFEPDQTFTYRPYNNTTRGQFAKMVVGAYNLPSYDPATPDFVDVPRGSTFFTYIEAAFHAGIINGYPDHTFRPNASITRGQLSKLVVLAAGWTIDTADGPHFTDVAPSSTFYDVIETAYHHDVISGYPCGGTGEPCDPQQRPYFRPTNTAIRGQIAKILWLALGSPAPDSGR